MENSSRTRKLLTEHYAKYPQLQIRDVFKFLYQSSFGCEHMVDSSEAATERIRNESACAAQNDGSFIDRLDGEYSRVHLACLGKGLSAETLGKLFFTSAKKEINGKLALEQKIEIAKELIREKNLPFSLDEFEKAAGEWQAEGYPAVHHSDVFRDAFKPSYRVIDNRYVPFLPLFARLDEMLKKGSAILAVEGGSASGKTTLSEMLKEIYGCAVFHMDDFFLRPEQRTPERYAEAGGNIDRERFLEEVLIPLSRNEPVNYRRFDCASMKICSPIKICPEKLTVIEGAYSMHPLLANYYDISVFLDVLPELQRKRISVRNSPQVAQRFHSEWIPLEREYFSKLQVKQRCSMTVTICE